MMNQRNCLKIAHRIHTLLEAELGEGIEPQRMLDDALYARDVLLVCEALHGTGLRQLARLFREESNEASALQRACKSVGLSEFVNSMIGPQATARPRREARPALVAPKAWQWFPRPAAATLK